MQIVLGAERTIFLILSLTVMLSPLSAPCQVLSEEVQVIQFLREAVKKTSCEKNHDLYKTLWAQNAVMINSRFAVQDRYTRRLPIHIVFEKSERRRNDPSQCVAMSTYNEVVTIRGGQAEVTWEIVSVLKSGLILNDAERYTLKKIDQQWKIVENQYWSRSRGMLMNLTYLDADYWDRADQGVEVALKNGDDHQVIMAFFTARRFEELIDYLDRSPAAKRTPRLDVLIFWAYLEVGRLGRAQDQVCKIHILPSLKGQLPQGWIDQCPSNPLKSD